MECVYLDVCTFRAVCPCELLTKVKDDALFVLMQNILRLDQATDRGPTRQNIAMCLGNGLISNAQAIDLLNNLYDGIFDSQIVESLKNLYEDRDDAVCAVRR